MRLVKNWRPIAARSHSMWAFYLVVLLFAQRDLTYWIAGRDLVSPLFYAVALAGIVAYGVWGRLRPQGIDHD